MGGFILARAAEKAADGAPVRRPGVVMPLRRGQRGLTRAGSAEESTSPAGGLLAAGLEALRRSVLASLDPLAGVAGPALVGAGGGEVGGRVRIAASTETPDRPTSPPPDDLPAGPADHLMGGTGAGGRLQDDLDSTGVDLTIVAILSRAQSGDAEAFGLLFDRYEDVVYRYIYYRVGNTTLAEDLTSETFVRALRRITTFSWQGRDFGAWLVTIARNLIADHFKSARYRLEVSTADLLGTSADRPAAGPEGQVLDSLTNAALLDAVRRLGAEQQEVIVLRFLEGLSVAETAQAMGKKPGAVKALQYRAVRSLGQLLPAGVDT